MKNGATIKTNIGTSVSKGIESFVELDIVKLFTEKSKWGTVSVYASNAWIDANYTVWNNPDIANDPLRSIVGKKVENVPDFIHRFGASYHVNGFTASWQYSSVGAVFTDASNTETPNAIATVGKLSGYQVMDASVIYRFMEKYHIKAGVNNMEDKKYATRRASGYPGPGILPGNGRTFFFTLGASF